MPDLSPRTQMKLANYLVDTILHSSRVAERSWPLSITRSDQGYFVIQGEDPHPLLTFRVDSADGKKTSM